MLLFFENKISSQKKGQLKPTVGRPNDTALYLRFFLAPTALLFVINFQVRKTKNIATAQVSAFRISWSRFLPSALVSYCAASLRIRKIFERLTFSPDYKKHR